MTVQIKVFIKKNMDNYIFLEMEVLLAQAVKHMIMFCLSHI